MKLDEKTKAMLASYGRSFIAAAGALLATGNTDPKGLIAAGLIAVIPVALRAFNPKDPAFGIVKLALPQITKQLDAILEASNKKAAAKKAASPKKK
jgi:hypothetical protein